MKNKKIMFAVLLVLACIFALSIAKDLIIKTVVSAVAGQVTGTKVSIRGFSLGILSQSVSMSGFKMFNPRGFSSSVLVDLPKANVDYNLLALLKGKLHLENVEIELKELGLEKNKEGKLNVDSLKVAKPKEEQKAQEKKKPAKEMAIQIDSLNLQMGRIVFKDYSQGPEPQVTVYDINLKKSYKNINSAQQLAALILSEPMKQAGIKGASIYAAAMLTGVGFIPVAIASSFAGKDSVQQEFKIDIARVYDVSLDVLKRIGKVNKEDKADWIIEAEVDKASVTLRLNQVSSGTTRMTIIARKYMLPKREIANGVLYQINEQLKK